MNAFFYYCKNTTWQQKMQDCKDYWELCQNVWELKDVVSVRKALITDGVYKTHQQYYGVCIAKVNAFVEEPAHQPDAHGYQFKGKVTCPKFSKDAYCKNVNCAKALRQAAYVDACNELQVAKNIRKAFWGARVK